MTFRERESASYVGECCVGVEEGVGRVVERGLIGGVEEGAKRINRWWCVGADVGRREQCR